jgi:hypothetical protein
MEKKADDAEEVEVARKKKRPAETLLLPWWATKRPKRQGQVRVAKFYPGRKVPTMTGYKSILIHTNPAILGGDLSPYVLKNEKGCILENIWQFSKVYAKVSAQRIALNQTYHINTIVWEHPEEVHWQDGKLLPEWWAWREKGMKNPYAVRYPNGFQGRHECLFSVWFREDASGLYDELDYLTARKKIYCAEYVRLAPTTPHFKKLKTMVESGTSLLLVEVDGPDPKGSAEAPYDQISPDVPGLFITEKTIRLLINDPKKPFGHGYVIAALLLDGQEWLK